MKTFKINYTGNNSRAKRLVELPSAKVLATTAREAVEEFYSRYFDENYFPQDNGEIRDCDGDIIATPDTDYIRYDGGIFEAIEAEE